MELVRGNSENLSGNAVIYWEVEGENIFSPNSKIIAENFVISAIQLDEKLFTATFPPIFFKDYDELITRLVNINCDIIYGGKMKFPTNNKELEKYIKKEIFQVNKIIESYTEKYKIKFNFNPINLSEKEKIYLLNNLSKKIRNAINKGKYIDGSTDSKPSKMLKLIKNLKHDYKKYDIDSFINILYIPGKNNDKLTNLYTKKFLAIYYEDYENAKALSEKILNLEKNPKCN